MIPHRLTSHFSTCHRKPSMTFCLYTDVALVSNAASDGLTDGSKNFCPLLKLDSRNSKTITNAQLFSFFLITYVFFAPANEN